jgi:hypothetical protein
MPAMRTVPRRNFTSAECGLGHQVGGHDGARGIIETVGMQSGDQPGQGIGDLGGVEFHSDHAGGCRQHLRGRQLEQLGRRFRCGQRHRIARARGAIGVAGVHQNGARQSAASALQVAPAEPHGRGLHAVLREYRGRRSGQAADDQARSSFSAWRMPA